MNLTRARMLPPWVTAGFAEQKTAAVAVGAVGMAFWAGLSWMLFTGRYIVASRHPILGTLTGIFALWGLAGTAVAATMDAPKT